MSFSDLPRVNLAHLPTPFEEMPSLARYLRCDTRLFVKRDDCTGLAFGGNKTRKLEFSMGAALSAGADLIITSGDVQSNHVRQTAAAAAKLGLEFHCIIEDTVSPDPSSPEQNFSNSGNVLLDKLLGAVIHKVDGLTTAELIDQVAEAAVRRGKSPYIVPIGASDGIGSMGYVECARELAEQWRAASVEPSHLVLGTGSAGTHAGVLLGLRALGLKTTVVGISVSEPAHVKTAKVRHVIDALSCNWRGAAPVIDDADILVFDEFVGQGYGVPTDAGLRAIELAATTEGLLLDPVYTGKAMAGMIALLSENRLERCRDVVFLHTGGAPALFGYPQINSRDADNND